MYRFIEIQREHNMIFIFQIFFALFDMSDSDLSDDSNIFVRTLHEVNILHIVLFPIIIHKINYVFGFFF